MSKYSLHLWIPELENFLRTESRMQMSCMVGSMNWDRRRIGIKCPRIEKRFQSRRRSTNGNTIGSDCTDVCVARKWNALQCVN
jgi:hypothetical protein